MEFYCWCIYLTLTVNNKTWSRGAPHWGLFRFQLIKQSLLLILCHCLVLDKIVLEVKWLCSCIANALVASYLLSQGRKKLEEAFQHGKHAIDDLVNVAKVLTIFLSSWRIRKMISVSLFLLLLFRLLNILIWFMVNFWVATGFAFYACCWSTYSNTMSSWITQCREVIFSPDIIIWKTWGNAQHSLYVGRW